MKWALRFVILFAVILIAYFLIINYAFNITSSETFNELSRKYCPDSSKFLLKYRYEQGAWDGDRTSLTCILNKKDSVKDIKKISFNSMDFDDMYWKNNDTVILVEKFTEFKSEGKSAFKDSVFILNGVMVKVIQKDPIDSSYSRIIIYQETSPDNKYKLVAYRYVKPVNGYYFLNVSVVKKDDSIPKFGNFFISKYDYDCIVDIRWNELNELSIKAPDECYYSFKDYLVKKQPSIKYNLQLDETYKGNIR